MIDITEQPAPPVQPTESRPPTEPGAEPMPAAPIAPSRRVQAIDILRGFAIFGILLVNMEFFSRSFYAQIMGLNQPVGLIDQLARWGIAFLAEAKFYSTFSFLFGLGMMIQYRRFQKRGEGFVPFFLRRMVVLLFIGLIHAYLFWVGDILIMYSVLGVLLLLLFRNRQPRTLLVWTSLFLLIPILLNGALYGLIELGRATPEGAQMIEQVFREQTQQYQAASEQADRVYATGNFVEITQQRVSDMNFLYSTWPFIGFNVLAMMVLGVYAGKRRIFERLHEEMPFIRRVWIWGLIVGVIGNLLYVITGESASRGIPSAQLLVAITGQTVGAPALSLFYMCSLVQLVQLPAWQRRLQPLASVGRMAISNYLLQTIICTTLFYSYGFGLYGQIGIAAGVLLTIAIYAIQIPLSMWWLRRFRFGPIEWFWRTLSYGRRQPMRVVEA
jgi:uncharacterized protein